MIRDHLADVTCELVVPLRQRDRRPHATVLIARRARRHDLSAQQAERRECILAVAEVVSDDSVATCLDERAQLGGLDLRERIDDEQDVVRGQLAPLELRADVHAEAEPIGERLERSQSVPALAVRIVVGQIALGVRDTAEREQHGHREREAFHIISFLRSVQATRIFSRAFVRSGGLENATSAK